MVGFKESDIEEVLYNNLELDQQEVAHVLEVMKTYYDGYRFPGSKSRLYNPTLAIFFLKKMLSPSFKHNILNSKLDEIGTRQVLVDRNTKVSDRVVNVISKIPSSSDIVYKLSNEAFDVIVDGIHDSFSLHEMLHPPPGDVHGHDRALSFLFYHGVVTLKDDDGDHNMKPVILHLPNKLAKIEFLDRLRDVLSLPEKLLYEFQCDPSVRTLYLLLNSIIEKQESLFDNTLSEVGLQHMIEAALRAQLSATSSLKAEHAIGEVGRCDLLLELSGCIVVIELKRIRLNALVPSQSLSSVWPEGLPITKVNWTINQQQILTEFLKCQQDDELINCGIKKNQQYNYGMKTSVREVLMEGISQVKKYASRVSEVNPTTPCYAFIVVQVGFPLVIQQVKFN